MSTSATPSAQPSDEQIAQQSREFLHDIFIDDVTQKMAIGRATMAAGYGIDPRPYARPFPGSTSNVTMASQSPKSAKSSIINAALAAVGGAGATALVAGLMGAFGGGNANMNVQPTIQPAEYQVIFDGEEGLKVNAESSLKSE